MMLNPTQWDTFHVFLAKIGTQSFRCSNLLNAPAFDRLMDALAWKMPYNLRAFHCSCPQQAEHNSILKSLPELPASAERILFSQPPAAMRLKDRRREQTLKVRSKYSDYVIAETEDGYGRLYHVDGDTSSLVTRLEAFPITLQEASAYINCNHRHNTGPRFHKFSLCLRAPGEPEPVGVAVASIPKARHQMDGKTLEINRCCADPRYANVCSSLYARIIRIGREMGYHRFLTYTLAEESGSSLRAVGFCIDGIVDSTSRGWDVPSRPRGNRQYPKGQKTRWVLYAP